ncbi:putative Replication protein A 30 kDa subunit [Zostera marina]|uniref:Putative Replication protein A 30 kDa subunit n=1 Tax=Zostera marina TaxID=29655 RepID=A0A0K9NUW0_ZOSMR|nr:putative Replication protein A 30 kDa subunit [Zostera marina]
MYSSQYDGNAFFSGGSFTSSQATQSTDSVPPSSSKNRGTPGVSPVTVKQISETLQSEEENSNFILNGAEITNVKLLGLVANKKERVTDVSFTLDDGTGRIDISRWVNEDSDTNEMAVIQNGMYVKVNGLLKRFQGKITVTAFSVRPVTDFDGITLHFIECIHSHLLNTKKAIDNGTTIPTNSSMNSPNQFVAKDNQPPVSNEMFSSPSIMSNSGDINDLVMKVFQNPINIVHEHGIHIEEVAKQLGVPLNKIKSVIDHHVNEGAIYSTIDDNHFKSAYE